MNPTTPAGTLASAYTRGRPLSLWASGASSEDSDRIIDGLPGSIAPHWAKAGQQVPVEVQCARPSRL